MSHRTRKVTAKSIDGPQVVCHVWPLGMCPSYYAR